MLRRRLQGAGHPAVDRCQLRIGLFQLPVPLGQVLLELPELLGHPFQRQVGLHPGQDHREVQWFGHIVVRPQPQGLHNFCRFRPGPLP